MKKNGLLEMRNMRKIVSRFIPCYRLPLRVKKPINRLLRFSFAHLFLPISKRPVNWFLYPRSEASCQNISYFDFLREASLLYFYPNSSNQIIGDLTHEEYNLAKNFDYYFRSCRYKKRSCKWSLFGAQQKRNVRTWN